MSCRSASPPPASRGTGASTRRPSAGFSPRSEEHTSELQSQSNLVCRLLLEKKKADADALAFFPFCNLVADCIDAPRDLMTGHTSILKSGPQTFFNEHVAVTNHAPFYFHAD